MVQSESAAAGTECEPLQSGALEAGEIGPPAAPNGPGSDLEDEQALRGVVAIEMPREVIARFSGTLILNELPERQPEIVLDRGPQSRDDDDE
jgi:hypothetical protein